MLSFDWYCSNGINKGIGWTVYKLDLRFHIRDFAMSHSDWGPCCFQVVISDVLEREGRATEAEFRVNYGHDHVTFIPADVTKQQDMEGVGSRVDCEMILTQTLMTRYSPIK